MQARQTLADIQHLLTTVLKAPTRWQGLAPFADTDGDLAAQVLDEVKAATAGAGKVVSPACPIRLSSQKTYLTGLYGTAYSGKKPANVIDETRDMLLEDAKKKREAKR